jgi:hypothetical protein
MGSPEDAEKPIQSSRYASEVPVRKISMLRCDTRGGAVPAFAAPHDKVTICHATCARRDGCNNETINQEDHP